MVTTVFWSAPSPVVVYVVLLMVPFAATRSFSGLVSLMRFAFFETRRVASCLPDASSLKMSTAEYLVPLRLKVPSIGVLLISTFP